MRGDAFVRRFLAFELRRSEARADLRPKVEHSIVGRIASV